ncbi:MAG: acyl transferase [Cyclobacteriaceae bacterium]
MTFAESFKSKLFEINEENFDKYALDVFKYQSEFNRTYKSYMSYLNIDANRICDAEEIPFLPISFWKNHQVKTGNWTAEKIFQSSGTTAQLRSQSHMRSLKFYETVFVEIFLKTIPKLDQTEIIALLPSYQEQGESSLIFMVDRLIKRANGNSAYYQPKDKKRILKILTETTHPKILFGVAYALLDLIEEEPFISVNTTVIETGGMKGRRKEITRKELHQRLKKGTSASNIYSEYGMTELTSQCYSIQEERFKMPAWMNCSIRDINDPFTRLGYEKTGGINIIDLANIDTCSFIETQDLGKKHRDRTIEVLGRFDHSDLRGCNLLHQ